MRRVLVGIFISFLVTLPTIGPARADGLAATLVRVIDATTWGPTSPDTSGLIYRASTGSLVVVDGEVEEISSLYAGVNVWDIAIDGSVVRTAATANFPRQAPVVAPAFSNEPTDAAWNPANDHLFISDDDADRIFELDLGPDGWLGGGDDVIITKIRTNTPNFLCKTMVPNIDCDSEGLTYAAGSLWIADGFATEIYRIEPGPNGRFDNGGSGPPPNNGDDVITHFDTTVLGMHNPEGVEYDAATGNLFIVSETDKFIAVATTTGELVNLIDISFTSIRKPSGVALAPGSNDPGSMNLYVSDRAVDNDTNPLENDGKIFEFSLSVLPGNQPPIISPMPKAFSVDGEVASVQAAAVDPNGDPVTYSATNLPPGVGIDPVTGLMSGTIAPGAHLSGPYLVQVSASDGDGVASTTFAWSVSRIYADLLSSIDTSQWSPPSPDPGGLTWRASTNSLLTADGEVEETGVYAGANVWEFTSSGAVVQASDTTEFSEEPTDVADDPSNGNLYFSDDSKRRIFVVGLGPDTQMGTSDDTVTSFPTLAFGSNDPEGVAVGAGALWIADGEGAKIYRLTTGPNGVFDGVAPGGDDEVSSFDTSPIGIFDPEGAEYDGQTGLLWIVSSTEKVAVAVTPTGTKVDQLDLSHSSLKKPGGVTVAPASADPSSVSLWVADRAVDNDSSPTENDGMIFEYALPDHPPYNQPPTVLAGADQVVILPGTAGLDGTVNDDGIPNPPGTTTVTWSKVFGAGNVSFGNANAVDTTASFSAPGTYVLRLTANDSELPGFDEMTVSVNQAGSTVTLDRSIASGSDDAEERASGSMDLVSSDLELTTDVNNVQTVGLRFTNITVPRGATITKAWVQFRVDEISTGATSLTVAAQSADNPATFTSTSRNISSRPRTAASVGWVPASWPTTNAAGPDQRTPDLSAVIQQVVGRSGWASGNALVVVITGTGRRTAEAFEGTGAPILHLEYAVGAPAGNQPPTVVAGPDQVVFFPDPAALDGTVNDDGLPNPPGATTVAWSKVSGPGTVTFGNANAVDTTASFSAAGTYVLRLTASDSALATLDEVTVNSLGSTSSATTLERTIAVGSDDAEERASGGMDLVSSDLELTTDGTQVQTVGLRFTNITVPRGATITKAWVQFRVDEISTGATSLTVAAQSADNPATFTSASRNISSRARTVASVGWVPVSWPTLNAAGPDQRTPDLSAVIQQVVGRSGWASGNAVVVVITGTGRRTAEAFEGTGAPILHLEYVTG